MAIQISESGGEGRGRSQLAPAMLFEMTGHGRTPRLQVTIALSCERYQ